MVHGQYHRLNEVFLGRDFGDRVLQPAAPSGSISRLDQPGLWVSLENLQGRNSSKLVLYYATCEEIG